MTVKLASFKIIVIGFLFLDGVLCQTTPNPNTEVEAPEVEGPPAVTQGQNQGHGQTTVKANHGAPTKPATTPIAELEIEPEDTTLASSQTTLRAASPVSVPVSAGPAAKYAAGIHGQLPTVRTRRPRRRTIRPTIASVTAIPAYPQTAAPLYPPPGIVTPPPTYPPMVPITAPPITTRIVTALPTIPTTPRSATIPTTRPASHIKKQQGPGYGSNVKQSSHPYYYYYYTTAAPAQHPVAYKTQGHWTQSTPTYHWPQEQATKLEYARQTCPFFSTDVVQDEVTIHTVPGQCRILISWRYRKERPPTVNFFQTGR